MHNGFVNVDSQKMSKSLRNFKTLRCVVRLIAFTGTLSELISNHSTCRDILKHPDDARAFRYLVVTAQVSILLEDMQHFFNFTSYHTRSQYRSSLSFTEDTFTAAKRSLRRIDKVVGALQAVRGVVSADYVLCTETEKTSVTGDCVNFAEVCRQCLADFEEAMCDDLNAPRATAALFVLVGAAEKAIHSGACTPQHAAAALKVIYSVNEVYGMLYDVPLEYFPDLQAVEAETSVPEAVIALAERRKEQKLLREFTAADSTRDSILKLGYKITDDANGYVLVKL